MDDVWLWRWIKKEFGHHVNEIFLLCTRGWGQKKEYVHCIRQMFRKVSVGFNLFSFDFLDVGE